MKRREITEEEFRKILKNTIIKDSSFIYDLDLNVIRRFKNDYFARCENKVSDLYQISEEVIDKLILEFASCAKDNIDIEDFADALEDIKVMMNLCELRDNNINKVKLW